MGYLEVVCVGRKGSLLPFHTRVAVCTILIASATVIAYNLAVKAPIETLTAAALTLTCATLVKLIGFEVRPTEYARLKRILKRLQTQTGLGQELKLVWIPNGSPNLAGEVQENVIYIYDECYEQAVQTLVEEFVEYCIAQASRPYIEVLNAIIKAVNEQTYKRRDKVAKAIARLLTPVLLNVHAKKRRVH